MPRNPYTGVHNPYPFFPAAEGSRPHVMSSAEDTDPITLADGTIVSTVWTDDDAGEPVTLADGRIIGRTINLEQFTTGVLRDTSVTTTEVMHDTSTTTAERLYAPGGGMVPDASNIDHAMATAKAAGLSMTEEQARDYIENATLSGASITLPGDGMGEIRAKLPRHSVEEVTLQVPVSHGKLTYALGAVDAVIAGRRAFGYTIPEESRTVTTIGNEIVIRWEEHS